MASIYLASSANHAEGWHDYPRQRILESYSRDIFGAHTITSQADEADVVFFATNHSFPPVGLGIITERAFRQNVARSVVFDSGDDPSPIIGGLCASWPSSDKTLGRAAGWCYHHPTSAETKIQRQRWDQTPSFLWSFFGSQNTHPVRSELLRVKDREAFLEDTSERSLPNLMGLTPADEKEEFHNRYVAVMKRSAFVACPRGKGPSSMRIFEAMRAGRAPVIISDDWTPPPFVAWEECSLRLPEADVHHLPDFLRAHRGNAWEMGQRAREEWERVFGPTGLFHHTVEVSLNLITLRSDDYSMRCLQRAKLLFRPPWRRRFLRGLKISLHS